MMRNKKFIGAKISRIDLLVVLAVLVSLGFPGNFTEIFGEKIEKILEYIAFFAEIAVMLLSSSNRWADIRIINLSNKYMWQYVFALIIFIESMLVSSSRGAQFITCARLSVTMFFAIWLQEHYSFNKLLKLLCTAQSIFVLFTVIFILLYPGIAFYDTNGTTNILRGLYARKNDCALELEFGIILFIMLLKEGRKQKEYKPWWGAILLLQFLLLVLCQATGTMLSLVVVCLLLLIPDRIRLPIGYLFVVGSVLFLVLVLTVIPLFEDFITALGKDATLTGRIPLWRQIISVMLENKTFTGFGYGAFWGNKSAVALLHTGFRSTSYMGQMATGSHNTLLELWLNSGLIGVAAFFAMILFSTRRLRELESEKYLLSSMVLTFLMMNGLTERSLGGNYDYKMLSLFLALSICSNQTPKIRKILRYTETSSKSVENAADKLIGYRSEQ